MWALRSPANTPVRDNSKHFKQLQKQSEEKIKYVNEINFQFSQFFLLFFFLWLPKWSEEEEGEEEGQTALLWPVYPLDLQCAPEVCTM